MPRNEKSPARGWKEIEELMRRVPMDALAEGAGIEEETIRKYRYQAVSPQVLQSLRTAAELWELRNRRTSGDVMVLKDEVSYLPKRTVPVVGFVAGADMLSNRKFDYSDMANQIEENLATDSKDPNALGLIVEGDSMYPELQAGDRIVVAPNAIPRNDDVVVARLESEGSAILKRFFRSGPEGKLIRLESRNPDYPPIIKQISEFRFIYPVVDMKRNMRR